MIKRRVSFSASIKPNLLPSWGQQITIEAEDELEFDYLVKKAQREYKEKLVFQEARRVIQESLEIQTEAKDVKTQNT